MTDFNFNFFFFVNCPFKTTKWLEKSGICHQRDVCCFTKRLHYDILNENYKVRKNYSNQPCWFCTALFISPLLFTATPTCLLQHLGRPSVSSYPHGLSTCLTRVDGAIRSCPLLLRTARTSRVLSVPSGLNMCRLWSPLPVSTALHSHINLWLLHLEIGR